MLEQSWFSVTWLGESLSDTQSMRGDLHSPYTPAQVHAGTGRHSWFAFALGPRPSSMPISGTMAWAGLCPRRSSGLAVVTAMTFAGPVLVSDLLLPSLPLQALCFFFTVSLPTGGFVQTGLMKGKGALGRLFWKERAVSAGKRSTQQCHGTWGGALMPRHVGGRSEWAMAVAAVE